MNKIRFSFYLLILVIIQTGCIFNKDEYEYVPKKWKLGYNEGDTLIYCSNFNNVDSFYLSELDNYYSVLDKTYYIEHTLYRFILINGVVNSNDYIFYESTISVHPENLYLYWLSFRSQESNANIYNRMVFEKYKLKGKVYDVYNLSRDTNFILSDTINKVLYHNKYGVMRYDYKTGEYFELQIK